MADMNAKPGTGGNIYIPYSKRNGAESVVYFTRDLSEKGLLKIYDRISANLKGRIAVKLHTGEAEGPNIIPRPWVKSLFESRLPGAAIVETNTYYEGSRYTTEQHRETLKTNGWTFCPVDITDEHGVAELPVHNGKWFDVMHVGKGLLSYDSLLVLTHFKGHTQGGFGGSNKNIGIGCADGRIGKKEIHTAAGSDEQWSICEEEFMERMTESTSAVASHFGKQVSFINVMRNMSVDCDCAGTEAEPVETPDVGILASLDILALDQACVDIVYSMPCHAGKHLIERIESRHGLRQLSYMKELGMGNDRYHLLDIDSGDKEITAGEACSFVKPLWTADKYNTFRGNNFEPEKSAFYKAQAELALSAENA